MLYAPELASLIVKVRSPYGHLLSYKMHPQVQFKTTRDILGCVFLGEFHKR